MSGLRVVNDLEFTVRLKAPTVDFTLRLGHSAFYPLPDMAFRDMAAFGRNPVGNGPYQLADGPDGPAWEHNVKIDLKPNPDYHGNRKPHNKGLRFEFYANLDTAYADLLSGNLDVLDTIPSSALTIYQRDLGDNATSGPVAVSQSLDTPLRLPHFGGEEGRLRRLGVVGGHQPSADLSADLQRAPAARPAISPPDPCRDSTRTSRATTHWTSTPNGHGNSGRKPTRSRLGAGGTPSPTTPTAAIRSGWTRWPTASRTCWASMPSARRSPRSRVSAPRSPTAPSTPRSAPAGSATIRR